MKRMLDFLLVEHPLLFISGRNGIYFAKMHSTQCTFCGKMHWVECNFLFFSFTEPTSTRKPSHFQMYFPIVCFRTRFCLIECHSNPHFSELVRTWYGVGAEKVYGKVGQLSRWGNWGKWGKGHGLISTLFSKS